MNDNDDYQNPVEYAADDSALHPCDYIEPEVDHPTAPDSEQSPEAEILKRLIATFCDFIEAGRTIPGARARLDVLRLLAGISDESLSDIAKRRKLSRQNLHQIAQSASESFGLTLPYQYQRKSHRRKREGTPT